MFEEEELYAMYTEEVDRKGRIYSKQASIGSRWDQPTLQGEDLRGISSALHGWL